MLLEVVAFLAEEELAFLAEEELAFLAEEERALTALDDLEEDELFFALDSVFALVDFLPDDLLEVCAKLAATNSSITDRAIYFFITFSFNY